MSDHSESNIVHIFNQSQNTLRLFLPFYIAALHRMWSGAKLLSAKTECTGYPTSCETS